MRVHDEVVYVGEAAVAMGREVDGPIIQHEMAEARRGLTTQLETFTHNSTEFLRREQDLLLHGRGLPRLATRIDGPSGRGGGPGPRAPRPSWPRSRSSSASSSPS